MTDANDIESRLAEVERQLATWQEYRKHRSAAPDYEIRLGVEITYMRNRLNGLADLIKRSLQREQEVNEVLQLVRNDIARLDEAYYHLFPDRFEQDQKVREIVDSLFPPLDSGSQTKPK